MPFAGLVFMNRLVRMSTPGQRHLSNRIILVELHKCLREIKTFSTGSVKWNKDEEDSSDPAPLSTTPTSRQALLSRRRRPLSPLERISGLLPQDALSPEVTQLREQNQQDTEQDPDIQVSVTNCAPEESGHGTRPENEDSETLDAQLKGTLHEEKRLMSSTLPGERLLVFGELLVAEYRKKGRVEFRKMFKLQAGERLHSSWGTILHDDMAGQPAGRFLKTSRGVPILTRRASLQDYVLYMKRGPAITYPKVHHLFVCHSPVFLFCFDDRYCTF